MRTWFFTGLLVLLSVLSSCTQQGESPVDIANRQGILLVGNGSEPQGLDPHIVTGVPENHLLAALFEGLVGRSAGGIETEPGLASSWDISENGLVYTFYMNPQAYWSNGDKVVAGDVVYSWKRILNPELGSRYPDMLYMVKNAQAYNSGQVESFDEVGVKAISPEVLQVDLESPTPYFLGVLQHYSTWPVHPPTIERFGGMTARDGLWTHPENIVSNGPFLLKEWRLNKVLRVKKNPNYWDADRILLNEIHFYPIEDASVEERMFRAGQLHKTEKVPFEKVPAYRNNPEMAPLLHIKPYMGTYFYRFNTTVAPFSDKRVRQALAYAIDRQLLVEKVTGRGEKSAYSFTPPGSGGFWPNTELLFDPERSRALLAEAGYPNGEGFPVVELMYNTDEGHRKLALAVQQMWKQHLGIKVELLNQEWKTYLARENALDYQVSRAGWIGDYLDPNTFMDVMVGGRGNNRTGWDNATYNRTVESARDIQDSQQRLLVFQQAEKILMEELPIAPIYTYVLSYFMRPEVKNWPVNLLDQRTYKDIYLQEEAPTL